MGEPAIPNEPERAKTRELAAMIVEAVRNDHDIFDELEDFAAQADITIEDAIFQLAQLVTLQADELAVPPALRPLTPQQIEDALNEGAAEAHAARGDNAYQYLLNQRREALRQRDQHRAVLNRIADFLRVVHEDDKIEAAVRKLAEVRRG